MNPLLFLLPIGIFVLMLVITYFHTSRPVWDGELKE